MKDCRSSDLESGHTHSNMPNTTVLPLICSVGFCVKIRQKREFMLCTRISE